MTDDQMSKHIKLLSDITSILATRADLFPAMQIDSPFTGSTP